MTMQDNQDLGNCEDQHPPSLGTVLLVEDNLRVSDELSLVLTTAGYSIELGQGKLVELLYY